MMMPLKEFTNKEIIWKAKNYPYDIPNHSFIFVNGSMLNVIDFNSDSVTDSIVLIKGKNQKLGEYLYSKGIYSIQDLSNRTPLLAYGANASFRKLRNDFSNLAENIVIPVIKAHLFDFDIVYSAHFSPYGSIPAALQYSPKTTVDIFITYLTDSQLKHMNKTENLGINYSLGRLLDIQMVLENNIILNEVLSYFTMHGCLFVNDSHISLSAIAANNRKFPQMDEHEVLKLVRNKLDKNKELDNFILENIYNEEIKKHRIQMLNNFAKKFSYEYYEILDDSSW